MSYFCFDTHTPLSADVDVFKKTKPPPSGWNSKTLKCRWNVLLYEGMPAEATNTVAAAALDWTGRCSKLLRMSGGTHCGLDKGFPCKLLRCELYRINKPQQKQLNRSGGTSREPEHEPPLAKKPSRLAVVAEQSGLPVKDAATNKYRYPSRYPRKLFRTAVDCFLNPPCIVGNRG